MDTYTPTPTPQQAPQFVYQPQQYPYAPMPKPENKFKPDARDFVFALAVFALGYIFARWVFFTWAGWGVTAFTAAYLIAVTCYLRRKGTLVINAETVFWLAITMLTGLSYALWDNAGMNGRRSLFLFCAAVYYVVAASGSALAGKTSNYLIIDAFKAVVIIPFRNFLNQYVSFKVCQKTGKRKDAVSALIGVGLAAIILAIVIPLLIRADSGGFTALTSKIADIFGFINANIILYIMLGIPVAAYIYGLASGAAHKKGTDIIQRDSVKKGAAAMRLASATTIYTALGIVCATYAVFILSQLPYFFSAFSGSRPEGWLSYSEYARHGFFELSAIAAINLAIITIGNIVSAKRRRDLRGLKAFNIVIAAITLILIATAFSKMALYIDALGLTMPRLLPCVFMVFMAVVFVALIALQKWDFSIVRFSLIAGCAIMCALCLSNPDALVVRYNAERYLSGTLEEFDTEILRRSGAAGVKYATQVFDNTTDSETKERIAGYLSHQRDRLAVRYDARYPGGGINAYSLESYLVFEAQKGEASLTDAR